MLIALTASAGLAAPAAAVPPGPNGEPPRPSTATGATVPAPTVSGPVARTSPVGDPAHGYPFLATDVDLAKAGYVEEEFLISGQATRYATGNSTTTATVTSTGHPYTTRIVVRRPTSAAKFNGTVIAEWNNVSNQWDQEVDWFQTHEHLLRQGYVWVGISAQRVGLHSATGLKAWSPTRYGALDATAGNTITDDTLSFDIFSQAVKALRSPAGTDPLGPLAAPDYVIATGHSQSGGRLRTYANSIQPLSNILDAIILHGNGGTIRTDLPTPVFRINSEGDISSGIGNNSRQADSATYRNWEVAGASHGDWKLITDYGPLRKRDIGTYPGGYPGEPNTCALPSLSRVPQHMVQNALVDHTVKWVAYGIAPPTAPVITTSGTNTVERDSLGLGQGGIRLAQHEVPVRVNSGSNTGPGFCFLDGSSVPLTDSQLAELYPTVQAYVDEVVAVTLENAEKGFIPADFTRDPAWYTDIRDLIDEYGTRLGGNAAQLKALIASAQAAGEADDKYRAMLYLDMASSLTSHSVTDAAARDGILRQTKAVSALLWKQIDAPTSVSVQTTVAGVTAGTLSLELAGAASFPPFIPGVTQDYTTSTQATVTSAAADTTLSVSEPGHLTNGAFTLPEPLRVAFSKSSWTGPVPSEKVDITFKQLIKDKDPLRTGTYSKTLTFTLSTTNP
ncbi:alpha/beta hydrolase domain-containing protein [Solirubrobacter deserti]|uniref:Alpha/beta hydrolase domain-containing protein n=1 Tax=Solirubrobacter deserti TaxID=2282478 RepID=A0ABT4RNK8_9ACTN|nr:alpha/beta hydrolase domain-containing protein [Solirubrobacter deserti]MDA0140149.1 alpha/beta hydrolase domain-containing protein [Solirubrobacter deserti]